VLVLSKHETIADKGYILTGTCPRCDTNASWNLIHKRIWWLVFGLFPIPQQKEYWLSCQSCNDSYKLNSDQIAEIKTPSKNLDLLTLLNKEPTITRAVNSKYPALMFPVAVLLIVLLIIALVFFLK
jgi:hypothetical protein